MNLHIRSSYTLLNSTLRIKDIVQLASKYNQKAIALCDFNVMYGALSFYHECLNNNIKPVFGLETKVNEADKTYSMYLYAKNDQGYKNLLHISTIINCRDELMSIDEICTYSDLFFVIGGSENDLEKLVIDEDNNELAETLLNISRYFKEIYVGIINNDSGLLEIKNKNLKKVCKSINLKTVAISKTYYATSDDEEIYRILCAIDQQTFIDDKNLKFSTKRYFRSNEELQSLYDEDDLKNTQYILNNCNVMMKFEKSSLPIYQNKFNVDSNTYLKELCLAGLKKRLNNNLNDQYLKRLNYELKTIIEMDFADYFLIVYDFIRYARKNDIYVGPGRGSAAGSLVSYVLGITHVDPIKYNLLFERFLNPERISMPDIDVDFPDDKRNQVIEYVRETYGNKCVANIITFNTLASKAAIRDVGKALKYPASTLNNLAKLIPNTPKITLEYVYNHVPNFKTAIDSKKENKVLFELCKKIEGLPRHISVHAAGIILSKLNIEEVCPLIKMDENVYSTQFTNDYLEELGLIKMDFLGLRNLTIIDSVVHHINNNTNNKFDIMKINLNDEKTIKLIQDVDTVGVFQLESEGMKNLLRKLHPNNFEEIAAAIALFRPGPMENIPIYLNNRQNKNNIHYLHPNLKPILENTYGVMVYQEQIMMCTQIMAGFSLGKADILRKAISKKKSDEMLKLKDDFINGSINKGYEKKLAEEVFSYIEKFSGYGFNRSHSIAYGLIAFQLAYLKANYPLNFFASLLDSVTGSMSKTSEYIYEARKRKVNVLGPSVNYSALKFNIENNSIRFPLTGIKNIGVNNAKILIEERNKNGLYHRFDEFVLRMVKAKLPHNCIEMLIDSGALDEFKYNRASFKASLNDTIRYSEMMCQDNLFNDFELHAPTFISIKENADIRSENEKEAIGFYLSNHPITNLRNAIDSNLLSLIEIKNKRGNLRFIGVIERVKQHRTKMGEYMAFVVLSDETGKYDLAIMPNLYNQVTSILNKGNYIYVEGKKDQRESVLANKISLIDRSNYE